MSSDVGICGSAFVQASRLQSKHPQQYEPQQRPSRLTTRGIQFVQQCPSYYSIYSYSSYHRPHPPYRIGPVRSGWQGGHKNIVPMAASSDAFCAACGDRISLVWSQFATSTIDIQICDHKTLYDALMISASINFQVPFVRSLRLRAPPLKRFKLINGRN